MRAIFAGPSGSGKSYLLSQCLKRVKNKKILICPTYEWQKQGTYKDIFFDKVYLDATDENLEKAIEKSDKDTIIIIDDFYGSELSKHNSKLYEWMPKIRHKCHIILLIQYLYYVGPSIRNNIDQLVVFKQDNKKVLRILADEYGEMVCKYYFDNVFNGEKYKYMHYNIEKNEMKMDI
jgi:hypothetical protein